MTMDMLKSLLIARPIEDRPVAVDWDDATVKGGSWISATGNLIDEFQLSHCMTTGFLAACNEDVVLIAQNISGIGNQEDEKFITNMTTIPISQIRKIKILKSADSFICAKAPRIDAPRRIKPLQTASVESNN